MYEYQWGAETQVEDVDLGVCKHVKFGEEKTCCKQQLQILVLTFIT